jgi:Mg2+ and Co2+ transporter CorA
MPQHKSENDDNNDKESDLIRFLFDTLKKHEEKMDQITNRLSEISDHVSTNVQKLNINLKRINDKATELEEIINNLKESVQ